MSNRLKVTALLRSARGGKLAPALGVALIASVAVAGTVSKDVKVEYSWVTGLASFVTGVDGKPIPTRPAAPRARVTPTDFLAQHGRLFGVTDPESQLTLAKVESDTLGYTHTTYHQVHQGVGVFSGVLKIHQNPAGDVTVANGDYYPIPLKLNTAPTLDAAAAQRLAEAAVISITPEVQRLELVIVDPGWYGDPSLGARLAYHIVLLDSSVPMREALFVDAHTGAVLDQWSMIQTGRNREIYDGMGTYSLPGTPARFEGDDPTEEHDVDAAYDYYGDTYNYYVRAHGRDSIDDSGMTMMATVNSLAPGCPNAYWDGYQMVFCTGTVTDDVLGHELTHGVTQHSASLIYQNQSGQLNESFSDVFGELIDLFNGDAAFVGPPTWPPLWEVHVTGPGLDTPNELRTACSFSPGHVDGVRWLLGEDATSFGGAIRDMWDPTCYGDPDRANSPLQTCNWADNGGVHSGSGTPSHAFAILTDGKTFNGQTVLGIGPIKAGAVWYRALTVYLTPASDFEDAYFAFNQAVADFIDSFPTDPRTGLPSADAFTAADATQVDKALIAVEMNTAGRCGQTMAPVSSDPPVQCSSRTVIFADDFESGVNDWTVINSGPPTSYDWVQTTEPLPDGRSGVAWFGADLNTPCWDDETGIHWLFSPLIRLPGSVSFPTLAFTHYVATEQEWDGGSVKIRVQGGDWQLIPASAFAYNPYNATLLPEDEGNTNPLAGQAVFTGLGGSWGTSVVDLSSLVSGGETVQFRFELSKDWCSGVDGWYVDDFELYDCVSDDCNANGVPDDVEPTGGVQVDYLLRQPLSGGGAAYSDADPYQGAARVSAERFTISQTKTIEWIKIWGVYYPSGSPAGSDTFRVIFHEDAGGLPGQAVQTVGGPPTTRVSTGEDYFGVGIWEFTLGFPAPVVLNAGSYLVEIYHNTAGSNDVFLWLAADFTGGNGFARAFEAPGQDWYVGGPFNLAIEISAGLISGDCNENGIPDDCDIASGTSTDSDASGIPDECECQVSADCDDGVYCNGTEQCVASLCQAGNDPCPGQICLEADQMCVQCVEDSDCDDGLYCNGTETCDANSTCQGGTPPCPAGFVCDEVDDACLCDDNDDCDDGVYCNGGETCSAAGVCEGGTYPCLVGEVCDEVAGVCRPCADDGECSDGVYCNGDEVCNQGTCEAGTARDCDDGIACTVDSCDDVNSVCVNAPDDSVCEDDDLCTVDVCDPAAGCKNTAVDCSDGVACTADSCDDATGQCVNTADHSLCDDSNPCTDDTCDPASGCLNVANNANACGDGLFCTGAETCVNGSCVAGTAPCQAGQFCDERARACVECLSGEHCDDADPCTVDTCPDGVCKHTLLPACQDDDEDGVLNSEDICPGFDDHLDTDNDDKPDGCDSCPNDAENDSDGDGVCGDIDNCPEDGNADQEDADEDGLGDACDECPNDADDDADDDGVCGDVDNCLGESNADQEDTDGDGIGDACDDCPADADNDADGDDVCGDVDNCPLTGNPNQDDADGDGFGDVCDVCPNDADNDADGDRVCGNVDQCPDTPSDETSDASGCAPSQLDADGDGVFNDLDECADTPADEEVDDEGCAASQLRDDDSGAPVPPSSSCGVFGMIQLALTFTGLVAMRGWSRRGKGRRVRR